MKLNNKGFAISSIMYIILILAVILISVTLAILSSRKLILDKIKKETTDNIYGISYNSVINTLKHEAISYATSNNISKENIKIGDFETSVSQDLLEHHELLDKYLTLYKNNYSYDVYLGQTKTVTDISKPISNMLGIVDYKIEGNSYQQTYTGKNLFNKDVITNSNYSISGEKITLKVITSNSSTSTSVSLSELCPNLEVGKTYTISYTTDGNGYVSIGSYNKTNQWMSGTSRTITEEDLAAIVRMGGGDTSQSRDVTFSNIQIEEGTKATAYEPYVGGVASPNPEYPQEIQSVGEKTVNLFDPKLNFTSETLHDLTIEYLEDEDCFLINGTSTSSSTMFANRYINLPITKNDVFSISTEYVSGTVTKPSSDSYAVAYFGKSDEVNTFSNWTAVSLAENNNKNESRTCDSDYISAFWFWITEGVSFDNYKIKIQLQQGSTATEYEPYGYKIPVKISGKNLLNIRTMPAGVYYNNYSVYLTEPVVVSAGEVPTEIDGNHWRFRFKLQDGTYLYALDNKIKEGGAIVNISEDNPAISIQARGDKIVSGQYDKIQIEYGTKATSYEPYVEPVTTNIYLDEPLRKIDDFKDSIYYLDQITSRKIGKVIYNGSESWGLYNTGNGYMTSNTLFIDGEPIMSNRFINSQINTTKLSMRKNYKSLYAYGTQTFHTTADDWEAFLTNNNMEVIGKLVSPSNGTTITLPQIQTNMGSSIIEVDTSILPSNVEFTVIEKIRKL